MKVEISKFAQRELEDAILYYELEQKGLGLRFNDEVKKSVDRIKIFGISTISDNLVFTESFLTADLLFSQRIVR